MKHKIPLSLILCLISLFSSHAENEQEKADSLINKATESLYNNPQQASYYASKVIALFPDERQNDLKARALFYYSQAENLLGNFDASIKSLYDALEYVAPSNKALSGEIQALIGVVYCKLSDYNKAIEMIDKATAIFKSIGDSVSIASCYNNRGIVHYSKNEFDTAEQFLQQALAINRHQKNLRGIAANLNNLCLYQGNFEEKIGLIREAIIINRNLDSQWSLGENYNNMGKQYFYAKQYSNALLALQKAYDAASSINAKELICDNYEYSSWVYEALGNYAKAYQCLTQLYTLSKSLQNGSKLRIVEQEISYKKYQDLQRKTELKEQAYQIELLRRNVVVLILLLISFILFGFFYNKWYKRKKNLQLMTAQYNLEQSEHQLTELKVRQQEQKLQSIQSALEDSRQEATSFAVFLHSRNELLGKIREMLKQGYKMDQQTLIPYLKKINAFISQYQNGDKTDQALLMRVEEKNKEFLQRLSEKHPGLTQGEKHLATLLRVNLSTKEIAMLTGNTPKTINMGRYRLRKSLELSTEDDLISYLQNI